jgi:hypothetical protein
LAKNSGSKLKPPCAITLGAGKLFLHDVLADILEALYYKIASWPSPGFQERNQTIFKAKGNVLLSNPNLQTVQKVGKGTRSDLHSAFQY